MKRLYHKRGRKVPPSILNLDAPPGYPKGYLEHRRREYDAFDALPAWARKVLRRTKREWQAVEVLKRIKSGDLAVDIIRDLEFCEQVCSEEHLNDHTLNPGDNTWKQLKPGSW